MTFMPEQKLRARLSAAFDDILPAETDVEVLGSLVDAACDEVRNRALDFHVSPALRHEAIYLLLDEAR
jgi:hypothetical protein